MKAFDLAYIDREPSAHAEPILLIHGFASSHMVNWVSTGWVKTLQRRRLPHHRNRQSRPRCVDQKLRAGGLYARTRWRATPRRCSIISASGAPMSWAIRWARAIAAYPGARRTAKSRDAGLWRVGQRPRRRRRRLGHDRLGADGRGCRKRHRSTRHGLPRLRRPDQKRPAGARRLYRHLAHRTDRGRGRRASPSRRWWRSAPRTTSPARRTSWPA